MHAPAPTLLGRTAVIGGSGFYDMPGLEDRREVSVETPFGHPSDPVVTGILNGHSVAFLARHGRGHRYLPTEVPVRANIFALKSLGVDRIIAVSAVGSMRHELAPRDVVIPDQLVDRTMHRPNTFFGDGIVAHVGVADPFCPHLSATLGDVASATVAHTGVTAHRGGTYVCIEGPQFSTKAESRIYRSWGIDIIGMTAIPEARLAREAEMCYAMLAFVTDYDVWHESAEPVTVEMVVANLRFNVASGQRIVTEAVAMATRARTCPCESALAGAIMTAPDRIPGQVARRLGPIVSRYLSG
jgi:5'-methylthioadenosine phosphorylase